MAGTALTTGEWNLQNHRQERGEKRQMNKQRRQAVLDEQGMLCCEFINPMHCEQTTNILVDH